MHLEYIRDLVGGSYSKTEAAVTATELFGQLIRRLIHKSTTYLLGVEQSNRPKFAEMDANHQRVRNFVAQLQNDHQSQLLTRMRHFEVEGVVYHSSVGPSHCQLASTPNDPLVEIASTRLLEGRALIT